MPAGSPYTVRRTGSIVEVDPAAWDSLAAEEVYARHGWLRTVEETVADAAHPVYFLLEVDGELLGGAICYQRRRGCDALGLSMLIRHRTVTGRLVCRGMCVLQRLWATVKLRRQSLRLR